MASFRAVRTWNRPGTKATVTLYNGFVVIGKAGGNRAERCNYALAYEPSHKPGEWQLLGLRSQPVTDGNYGNQVVVEIEEEDGFAAAIDSSAVDNLTDEQVDQALHALRNVK